MVVDAGKDALVGAALSAAIPVAGEGVKKLGSGIATFVKDTSNVIAPDLVKNMKKAYELGLRKLKLSGDEARGLLNAEIIDTAKLMKQELKDRFDTSSKDLGRILNEADSGKLNHNEFIEALDDTIKTDGTLSKEAQDYILQKVNHLRKNVLNEEIIPGAKLAQERLDKAMEKARGKNQLLGQDNNLVTQIDPTEQGNFEQAVNIRMSNDGSKELSKQVIQTAVPEDKVVTTINKDFRTLSLSDLDSLKRELNSKVQELRKSGNNEAANQLRDKAKLVQEYIDSNLREDLLKQSKFANEQMREIHRVGNIESSLDRFSQTSDPDSYIKTTDYLRNVGPKADIRNKAVNELGKFSPNLMDKIDDVANRERMYKIANAQSLDIGKFGIGLIPKGAAVRAANYTGRVASMLDDAMSKDKYVKLAESLGDSRLAKMISTPLTPENRSKLIFTISQQPTFRKLHDKELEEQEQMDQDVS